MYRYKWILYSLALFLGLNILIVTNVAFGAENCRGKEVTDINLKNAGHKYTCEYKDEDSMKRLNNYCQRTSNTTSDPINSRISTLDCPKAGRDQLYCHICYCSGERNNGRCEAKAVTGEAIVTEDTNQLDGEAVTNIQTGDEQNNQDEPCPGGILNSQGKCCKKTYYDLNLKATVCCEGILLSTNVPFIGQCIVYRKASDPQQPIAGLVVDENTAFPVLMGGLSKILVSIILLVSFIGILIGGVMISASGGSEEGAKKGRKIIGNVISALALLGASGVILKLINPNFFG